MDATYVDKTSMSGKQTFSPSPPTVMLCHDVECTSIPPPYLTKVPPLRSRSRSSDRQLGKENGIAKEIIEIRNKKTPVVCRVRVFIRIRLGMDGMANFALVPRFDSFYYYWSLRSTIAITFLRIAWLFPPSGVYFRFHWLGLLLR